MASGLLPKSPVSSSLCAEVPHIFIPKSHLEPREFLISSAKRLLQQYRSKADKPSPAKIHFCPLLSKSGQDFSHPAFKASWSSSVIEECDHARQCQFRDTGIQADILE